ncbi:hypothetical protein H4582DRAFT_2058328 [Lactarius indigo]|nr:hypothetical protein H4582DRAFT_2058328 [Lactarius indigo]
MAAFLIVPVWTVVIQRGPFLRTLVVVLGVDNNEGVLGRELTGLESSKIFGPIKEEAVKVENGVLVSAAEGEGTVGGTLGNRDGVADAEADVDMVTVGNGDGPAKAETNINMVGMREGEDGDDAQMDSRIKTERPEGLQPGAIKWYLV